MSLSHVCETLSSCGVVGHCLQQTLAQALEACLQAKQPHTPLLWLSVPLSESRELAQQMHRASQLLFSRKGRLIDLPAAQLLQHLQQQQALHLLTHSDSATLFVHSLEALTASQRAALWTLLEQEHPLQNNRLWLLAATQEHALDHEEFETTHALFGQMLWMPPLYQRGPDIDAIICDQIQGWLQDHQPAYVEGFSLEAVAHIHRAILQTQRDTKELQDFLFQHLHKADQKKLPLHEGYVAAWTTVRALEEMWGYRMLSQPRQLDDQIQEYDFQERLFAASLEYASWKGPFSRDLLELQSTLLRKVLDELPEHQRNYQGLTANLDQLLWMSMKLLSGARTQAELRDFFGFGTDGKIPKATAKLKFDQYHLDQYGFRPNDPQPWNEEEAPGLQDRLAAFSLVTPQSPYTTPDEVEDTHQKDALPQEHTPPTNRGLLEVTGELEETLFLQYQDLFTILSADPLTLQQIADLSQQPPKKLKKELTRLVEQGLLEEKDQRYHTPAHDLYYMHTHSKLRFMEENLTHRLGGAFQAGDQALLENNFLRLPEGGLPQLRQQLLDPFLTEKLAPHTDSPEPFAADQPYTKKMYALVLLGTNRLNPQVHGRTPLKERVMYYFREASLQRADLRNKNQAICLQATMMLDPQQAQSCMKELKKLRKQVRQHLPQGRGNKPNFNLTYCFTEVPLRLSPSPLSPKSAKKSSKNER